MDFSALQKFLIEQKYPAFRLKQIRKNYFSGRFKTFDEMSDLPKVLRRQLSENITYLTVKSVTTISAKQTQKSLLGLSDGQKVETVLMEYEDWLTACISSQVGCPLGCRFCATGKMGFKRNLSADEIVDQVLYWNQQLFPRYIGRVVFMGMGEPFLNWDNVSEAVKIINSKEGLNIGARKMSISTAGVIEGINKLADLDLDINLAISLHSAVQTTRESIMPIAKKYSLDELKKALVNYINKTNRQVFFEYALIKDINDTSSELQALIRFIKSNRLFFLNLIPLNRIDGGLTPSDPAAMDNFIRQLTAAHINFSVRHSFGADVNAACGQLAGH